MILRKVSFLLFLMLGTSAKLSVFYRDAPVSSRCR